MKILKELVGTTFILLLNMQAGVIVFLTLLVLDTIKVIDITVVIMILPLIMDLLYVIVKLMINGYLKFVEDIKKKQGEQ